MKRNHQSPKSHLEETLVIQMKREKVPQAVRGHRFHKDRRWQFDFCYPDLMLAFEVEGGIWRRGGGAHSSGLAILRDIEKYNEAGLLGWRVFRIHTEMIIKDNRQMDEGWKLIREALLIFNPELEVAL